MYEGDHANSKGFGILRSIAWIIVCAALILGLSFLLRTFVIEPYTIPSGSMEQTILTGDNVFGEKITYHMRDPEAGDVVVFNDPQTPSRLLIKRVVATSGQTVNFEGGKLVVDGVAKDEGYTNGKESYPLANTIAITSYPYTVPEGYVFVMGDNRTNSQDSRYFGAIPVSSIQSRAFAVYWPISDIHFF
ncbi:MAG: signal peptidase I [Phoenicibacter congonensis]|uniref:Signal peptidase I n=1 Tax=Phoenicibacter congonensis TaxID=1944646 RepID=A0AA43RGJ1_9ACTN|nr:signal peptidase I [Phoenicibacter congonensis]